MAESFGRYLRRERELREISLEEISRQTKIKLSTLTALEEDRFPDLPPAAFVRGFIRNYAECIGLDPRDAILRLDHFLQENFPEKVSAPPPARKKPRVGNRLLILCFGFLLASLFFFAYYYADRFLSRPSPIPAPPAAVPALPPPLTGETTQPAPAPPAPETPSQPAGFRLHLLATDLCWVQYALDHGPSQEAQLQAGDTLNLEADQSIQILVGNAGGLRVQFNDQWLPPLGPVGQLVRLSFPPPEAEPSASPAPAQP